MRRFRWLLLAVLLPLLLLVVSIPLRQMEATGRARALARAVSAGDHGRTEALLAQGADPNTLVAYHSSSTFPMVMGYQSLVQLAEQQGHGRTAKVLRMHGGAAHWDDAPLPAYLEWVKNPDEPSSPTLPFRRLWERICYLFKEPQTPKVDLLQSGWQANGWIGITPGLLILGGALRMLGVGLPRSSDALRTQRSLAQGAGLIGLGTLLAVFVAYLVP